MPRVVGMTGKHFSGLPACLKSLPILVLIMVYLLSRPVFILESPPPPVQGLPLSALSPAGGGE